MEAIIFCDFDGTIALQDVNNTLCFHYGDEYTDKVEEDFSFGKIGTYDSLSIHYKRLKITEKEFVDFIYKNIEIDPYFKSFYNFLNKKKIDIAIISGGFINYINIIFTKYGIEITSPIYASNLEFSNKDIKVKFFHEKNQLKHCQKKFGICGVCKELIIKEYKGKRSPIIYIGDGLTDRCAIEVADIVLAKKGKALAVYCQEKRKEYRAFSNFKEVKDIIDLLIS